MEIEGQYKRKTDAERYKLSHEKPDKQHSILPTVMGIAGDLKGKVVLDCGCGDGFFGRACLRRGASKVVGIDSSAAQVELGMGAPAENLELRVGDIYDDEILPEADLVLAPFMAGYAHNTEELKGFFSRVYTALTPGGRITLVVDVPSNADLKRFGAEKRVNQDVDEAELTITLYDRHGEQIKRITAVHYTQATVENLLKEAGFKNITWHRPIVDPKGIETYGEDFWKGYRENPELGYVTGDKVEATV